MHVGVTDQVSVWVHVGLALAVYPVLHAKVLEPAPTIHDASSEVDADKFMLAVETATQVLAANRPLTHVCMSVWINSENP